MNNNKWFVYELLMHPIRALDLVDAAGNPDHSKIMPAGLLVSAIVLQFLNRPFDHITLLELGSLSYGYGAWRTFLKSKSVTEHTQVRKEQKELKIIHETILARRLPDDGVDPTHE